MTNKQAQITINAIKFMLDNAQYSEDVEEALDMAIKALSRSETPNGWIPCSERLPEDDVEVFVYLFERPAPYIAWVEDCRWYTEDFEVEKENYPTAWMPLPEPWKGGANDMRIGIPQIIMIVIYSMKIGINLIKDGEQSEQKYSFIGSCVSVAISVAILKWGGFFG